MPVESSSEMRAHVRAFLVHPLRLALCVMGNAVTLNAQIVRGSVAERASATPIAGVVVALVPEGGSATGAMSVLSNERGEFAIRASAPGRYRLNAKRIGAQRFVSELFELAAGESRRIDITLDALVFRLPEVRVVEVDLCVSNASERQRVFALWDEARTVLTAAQISLRDRLFEGHLTRYVRGLHPRSLRVLEESWAERKGMMDRPFYSLSGDSLSQGGYRRTVGEYEYYYAPDADVLLSRAFRRDHCYSVVDGGRERRGLIGIGFEPAPARKLPDVRGTLWLDARTFELRLVEFRYTLLPPFEGADRVGGEVHFGKLANGAWVTSRWFMRFPQYARSVTPLDAYTRIPSVIVRPTMHRLVEEGGMVFTAGLKLFLRPAAVAGVVLDSAGRPFEGATIRLGGTPFTTRSAASGSFRVDSLPAGRFTLIVEHPTYTQVGSFVAEEPLELSEGVTSNVTMRAPKTKALVERLCEGKLPNDDNGTIRVVVVDSVTSRPLPSLRVWLRWAGRFRGSMEEPKSLMPTAVGGSESLTDGAGTVTFCNVPSDVRLVFSAVLPDGKPAADSTNLRVGKYELRVWTVTTRRP
jgi:hypothetical protein